MSSNRFTKVIIPSLAAIGLLSACGKMSNFKPADVNKADPAIQRQAAITTAESDLENNLKGSGFDYKANKLQDQKLGSKGENDISAISNVKLSALLNPGSSPDDPAFNVRVDLTMKNGTTYTFEGLFDELAPQLLPELSPTSVNGSNKFTDDGMRVSINIADAVMDKFVVSIYQEVKVGNSTQKEHQVGLVFSQASNGSYGLTYVEDAHGNRILDPQLNSSVTTASKATKATPPAAKAQSAAPAAAVPAASTQQSVKPATAPADQVSI